MVYGDIEEIKSKELNLPKYLEELKEKIEFKGIEVELEDQILRKFLRSKNYDVKTTANVIKKYTENFDNYPDFFKSLSFSEKAFEADFFRFLPEKSVNGEPIAVLRLGVWEPDEVSFQAAIASTVISWEYEMLNEDAQLAGGIEIIDCSNVGMKLFSNMGMNEVKLMCEMSEGSLPIKWRKVFFINANNFIEILFGMAKPLLSKELKEQIVMVSQDMHELHEVIPKHILPAAYGGTADEFTALDYFQKIKTHENDLLQMWKKCRDK